MVGTAPVPRRHASVPPEFAEPDREHQIGERDRELNWDRNHRDQGACCRADTGPFGTMLPVRRVPVGAEPCATLVAQCPVMSQTDTTRASMCPAGPVWNQMVTMSQLSLDGSPTVPEDPPVPNVTKLCLLKLQTHVGHSRRNPVCAPRCPMVPHGPTCCPVVPVLVPMFPTFFAIFAMVPIVGPEWFPSIPKFPTRSPTVPTVPNGVHGPDSVQTVPNSPNGPAKWSRMVPNGHRRSRFSQMVPNALGLFGPVWGRFVIIGTFDCVWDRSGPCGTVGPVEKIGDRMEHVGTALGTVWDRVGPCGTIGTAGDGWGPLGTAGDRWGQLGTVWDGGVTSGRTAVHAVHAVHADRMGVFSVADRVGRS